VVQRTLHDARVTPGLPSSAARVEAASPAECDEVEDEALWRDTGPLRGRCQSRDGVVDGSTRHGQTNLATSRFSVIGGFGD